MTDYVTEPLTARLARAIPGARVEPRVPSKPTERYQVVRGGRSTYEVLAVAHDEREAILKAIDAHGRRR